MTANDERRRSRRHLPVLRATTVSIRRMTKRERQLNALLAGEVDHDRPRTRGECLSMERPCPFVGCKYHLYLEVSPTTGNIKFNFPGLDFDELPETCALDVADQDGMTLEDVGDLLNVTRERIRMIEVIALAKVVRQRELGDHAENRPGTKRRLTMGDAA